MPPHGRFASAAESAIIAFPPQGAEMRRLLTLRRPLLGLLVAALAGCGNMASFQRATGSFAEATTTGARAFAVEFDTASSLCRKRARLDFLQRRLQPNAKWGESPYWTEWYELQRINPENPQSETWKTHCEGIAAVEPAFRRGLELLAAYGQALVALSGSGGYDGCDLRSAAQSAAGIMNAAHAPSMFASIAGGAGDPIARMASFLFEAVTVGQMHRFVRDGDPTVQAILTDLLRYTRAVDTELRDTEARLASLLVTLDIRMAAFSPTVRQLVRAAKASGDSQAFSVKGLEDELRKAAPVDPVHAVELYRFASSEEDKLRALRRTQESYAAVLDRLAQAHSALARSTSAKRAESAEELKKALGLTTSALQAAAAIRFAVGEER
jgi:hypothetical protein